MNRFSSGCGVFISLLVLALMLLIRPSQASSDECCLCNDCDLTTMNLDATVYDVDEDKFVGCSDFAELVLTNVKATSDSCHAIQAIYQSSCCRTTHNLSIVPQPEDHRELQAAVPFSRRELWEYQGWSQSSTPVSSANLGWGSSNPNSQLIYQPTNTNGMALGCVVPPINSGKTVQVYSTTPSGFTAPTNVNCATASQTGLPISPTDKMYQVATKCVRCNCCTGCTGIDANVCVGNNQPNPAGGVINTWWATPAGSVRRRFL